MLLALLLCTTPCARAGRLVVELSSDLTPENASATDRAVKQDYPGNVKDRSITFDELPAYTPLDVRITTGQGQVLQGVDMSWYAEVDVPSAPPEPLGDGDVTEITSICRDIPSFYNRSDLLLLTGDRERAVALVQLIRDKAFHADKGGEIIWRVELWYFENQAGGWAKVVQSNRILRRERFESKAAFDQDAGVIRWVPQLGGIRVKEGSSPTRVTLPAVDVKPSAGPVAP